MYKARGGKRGEKTPKEQQQKIIVIDLTVLVFQFNISEIALRPKPNCIYEQYFFSGLLHAARTLDIFSSLQNLQALTLCLNIFFRLRFPLCCCSKIRRILEYLYIFDGSLL